MLLFELFSIGKRKTDQSKYRTSIVRVSYEYRIWSEINYSNCRIKVKVGGVFAGRYQCRKHLEGLEGLQVIFGEYSDI